MTTFVLVSGAWLGSWAWKKVVPLLRKRGHKVYTLALTGMGERVHLANKDFGMEVAIQDVVNLIEFEELNEVRLVGHSFAGKVVAAVADRVPERIGLIIYLDAIRPEKVRTPQCSFDPTQEFGTQPPGSISIPFSEEIIDAIGSDVKEENRKWMLSKGTPWPIKLGTDPITLSKNFDSMRNAYIFCSRTGDPVDEILQGKWGKLEGPTKVIDSGHWPMVTRPEELAEALVELSQ